MKIIVTYSLLAMIGIAIVALFYSQEIQYWMPTPVPADHVDVPIGQTVTLAGFPSERKKFIHFYNPNCPCSKFNLASYKELLRNYSSSFDCYAVVQETLDGVPEKDKAYLEKLNVKLIADADKTIARAMGVYATPQIVLLDENNTIYYRGNYNLARYCTNASTNFAQIAMDSLLVKSQYYFPQSAFSAYGCSLERPTH